MPENFLEINGDFALTSYCNTIGQSHNAFSIIGFFPMFNHPSYISLAVSFQRGVLTFRKKRPRELYFFIVRGYIGNRTTISGLPFSVIIYSGTSIQGTPSGPRQMSPE